MDKVPNRFSSIYKVVFPFSGDFSTNPFAIEINLLLISYIVSTSTIMICINEWYGFSAIWFSCCLLFLLSGFPVVRFSHCRVFLVSGLVKGIINITYIISRSS